MNIQCLILSNTKRGHSYLKKYLILIIFLLKKSIVLLTSFSLYLEIIFILFNFSVYSLLQKSRKKQEKS